MNGLEYYYMYIWGKIVINSKRVKKNIAFGYQHKKNDADDTSKSN